MNNYLGLSNNKKLIKVAKDSYDKWGFGLSSAALYAARRAYI